MGDSRKDVLLKALEAEVGGGSVDPSTLFTDDVVGWSPFATVSGFTALTELAAVHDMSFSNVASRSGDSTKLATRRSPNG